MKRPEFRNSGIKVGTLIELVENTAPFLWDSTGRNETPTAEFRYIEILQNAKANPPSDSDLWSYFELCIASHFATVGTFVPTDVDLAIRSKLWKPVHNENAFSPMWKLVQEFHSWDESPVSKRFVFSPVSKLKLSGHQGEWFTIAMGAYGCASKVAKEDMAEVRESIEAEIKNHEIALTELRDAFVEEPNVESMKAYLAGVAAVAHNLGDLDRMFELWEIPDTDVLKRRVFRLGHEDAKKPNPLFQQAGSVYQKYLAAENHRHFALREPKSLRRRSNFLLTYAPFLEEWGMGLVKSGFQAEVLTEGDLREIVEALVVGWKKLNPVSIYASQGYARALWGIAKALGNGNYNQGREELYNVVPPVIRKEMIEGGLRTLLSTSKEEFEKKLLSKLRVELSHESE